VLKRAPIVTALRVRVSSVQEVMSITPRGFQPFVSALPDPEYQAPGGWGYEGRWPEASSAEAQRSFTASVSSGPRKSYAGVPSRGGAPPSVQGGGRQVHVIEPCAGSPFPGPWWARGLPL